MSRKKVNLADTSAETQPEVVANCPEVVEVQPDAIYKPKVKPLAEVAVKTGDIVPVYGAISAKLESGGVEATDAMVMTETERVMTDVSISQCLKDEMVSPNAMLTVGDNIVTNARAIGKVLVSKALSGDMSAIREVLNRTEGRVPSVNMNKSASVKVSGDADSIAALMDKIDKNRG